MIDKKIRLLCLYGGKSPEHNIAVVSALHLLKNINPLKYNISALYISNQGKPTNAMDAISVIDTIVQTKYKSQADKYTYALNLMKEYLMKIDLHNRENKITDNFSGFLNSDNWDFVFPVFHGINGEDGTVQGMLEFMDIAYGGCSSSASSLCMDKRLTKSICIANGIPVLDSLDLRYYEWNQNRKSILEKICNQFQCPMFIKPSHGGSSIGIMYVEKICEIPGKLEEAFSYDDSVIIEQALSKPLEIMMGVMGIDNNIQLSSSGEFQYTNNYFDYCSKYNSGLVSGNVPAKISEKLLQQLKDLSLIIFRQFNLSGYARLDFFISKENIYLNEINTIPSLEDTGTFMKAWYENNITYSDFIDSIIKIGIKRKLHNDNFIHHSNISEAGIMIEKQL